MSKNELYSWLIPYLEGELDPKRKEAVEARLGIDAEYAAEAARLKNVLRHVQASGAIAPQAEPEFSIWPKVQSQLRAHPAQNRWSPRLSLAAGAFATVLIAAGIAHPWESKRSSNHPTMVASRSQDPAVAGIVQTPKLDGLQNRVERTAKNLEMAYSMNGNASAAHPHVKVPPPAVPDMPFDDPDRNDGFGADPKLAPDNDPFNRNRPVSANGFMPNAPRTKRHRSKLNDSVLPLRGGFMDAKAGNYKPVGDSVVPSAADIVYDRLGPSDTASLQSPVVSSGTAPGTYIVDSNNSFAASAPGASPKRLGDRAGFTGISSPSSFGSKVFSPGGFGGGAANGRAGQYWPHDIPDSQKLHTILQDASVRATHGNVNAAMDSWRDAMMFELQPPTYDEEGATAQATSILETIRKTGNLVPFRAYVERQALPKPDAVVDWRILGLLYSKQGNTTLALNAWEYVTQSGKASGEDWYQLGLTRQAAGDNANARLAFAHAVSGLTGNSTHYAAAQQALSAGQ